MPDLNIEDSKRGLGMDHSRYQYRSTRAHPDFTWPDGSRCAVALVVHLESFRLAEAKGGPAPLGHPMVEYPDFWGYTQLEYGNRSGLERIAAALTEFSGPVSAAINSELVYRYPRIISEVLARDWEILGHGVSSSLLAHQEMSAEDESQMIDEGLTGLRKATGQPVTGWLSPSLSESLRTPDLLQHHDVTHVLDWVNDELPYPITTRGKPIYAIPYAYQLSDLYMLRVQGTTTWSYLEQAQEGLRFLAAEAAPDRARCICLPIHPWLLGVPHRIGYFEQLLATVSDLSGVWLTTPSQIARAYSHVAGQF